LRFAPILWLRGFKKIDVGAVRRDAILLRAFDGSFKPVETVRGRLEGRYFLFRVMVEKLAWGASACRIAAHWGKETEEERL
jgi:hypothetical protein